MKQRQLTQKEIDMAPGWATHYTVVGDRGVLFESKYFYQALSDGILGGKYQQLDIGVSVGAQPMPPKAFDLSEYKFSDKRVCSETSKADGRVWLIVKCSFGEIPASFNKTDSIAIAKALGVTAEDLRKENE